MGVITGGLCEEVRFEPGLHKFKERQEAGAEMALTEAGTDVAFLCNKDQMWKENKRSCQQGKRLRRAGR